MNFTAGAFLSLLQLVASAEALQLLVFWIMGSLAVPSGDGAGADRAAMVVLDSLGIGALALEPLGRLSRGQRQMVGQAQVFRDPGLLLDKPSSALDMAHQIRVRTKVRRVAAEVRVVLAVLHDLALAAQWANRIAVLQRGLHSFGMPAEVVIPDVLT